MNSRSTLHRLSLLEQWRYDSFRLLFFIAVLLIFSAIILWILPLFSHGNTQAGFIGLTCGLAINLWLTCIARLHIARPVQADRVVALLESYHYRKCSHGYYDLPIARYKKFKSQRIYLEQQQDAVVLTGPHNILKKVLKKIDSGDHSGKDTSPQ